MKRELRELVKQLVDELLDEATYRKDYVEGIYNVLYGALGEHCKARYAEANGCATQQDIDHWDKEVTNHLDSEFVRCVTRKAKGFKRQSAFEEALDELRGNLPHVLRWAKKQVSKKCAIDINRLEEPREDLINTFFIRVIVEFEFHITA